MENGKKISIDSSTLMNKILELIEAQKLFNIPKKKIRYYYSSKFISSCNY